MKSVNLSDAREKAAKAHAEKVLQLFRDHPEIAETAIIIDPDNGIFLTPEGMSCTEAVGYLERCKFARLMAEANDCQR